MSNVPVADPFATAPETAALLGELKGLPGAPSVTTLDAHPDAPQDPNPLKIVPAAPTPLLKAADAIHSKPAGGKGYRVTVSGEYYAPSADHTGKIAKRYKLDFNVPSLEMEDPTTKQTVGALGVIVGKLLIPALKRLDPSAIGYRTHEVVETKPLGDAPPTNDVQYMGRPALEAQIAAVKAPIDVEKITRVEDLRESLVDFLLNPKGFAEREAARHANREQLAELHRMNPELADDAPLA